MLSQEKIKVLVVDDNKRYCDMMGEIIANQPDMEYWGSALDGLDAIDVISAKTPDLVLLDMKMPRACGLDVIQRVNDMQMEHKPSFIVMSASYETDTTRRALELGALDYINKPISIELLFSRIRSAISKTIDADIDY